MKTSACRDGILKNQQNKMGTTPQHIYIIPESQVSESLHVAQFPHRVRCQTCVAREHGRLLLLLDTAKGVACEIRSAPPPSPASLAAGSTPRAKRTCLLALLDVKNAISLCSHFCCTNNRIFYVYELN